VLLHGEMRSFSRATIDENLARMDEIIARESSAAGTTYQFEHILKYSDFNLAPESVAYQLSRAAITGLEVPFEPIRTFGGSDANNYNKHNIATVNLGMGYVNNHSHKEYISVDDLVLSAEIGVRIVELAAKFGTQSGK
jgi:tripeptide aminopeptidase